MTDEWKIQWSTTINGELVNFRAQSGTELQELAFEVSKVIGPLIENMNNVKQVVIADGILTAKGSGGLQPLPSSAVDDYTCKHGAMKDLSDKNYKYTHYCPAPKGEEQCPPKGRK